MILDPNDKDFVEKIKNEMTRQNNDKAIIGNKINHYLEEIDISNLSKIEKKQKTKELIDLGKFLYILDNTIQIKEVFRESPDFVLEVNDHNIGIELMDLIIRNPEKEKEGILASLFKEIESELKLNTNENFGIYRVVFLKENFSLKKKVRENIKREFFDLVNNEQNIETKYIKKIVKIPSKTTIDVYRGLTTVVGHLDREVVERHIECKNDLLKSYQNENLSKFWLLLVINGVEKSSDYSFIHNEITDKEFETNFDRIFIFDFYSAEIFELKVKSHNNV